MTHEQIQIMVEVGIRKGSIERTKKLLDELEKDLQVLQVMCDHDYDGNEYRYRQCVEDESYYTCKICGAIYSTPKVRRCETICKNCGEKYGNNVYKEKWSLGICGICGGLDVPIDTPQSFGLTGRIVDGEVEREDER